MNVLKPVMYTAVAGLLFASCKSSINTIPVPKGTDTVINIPAKKGTLTEDQLQTWSHMDVETDSIPGMSLDKAYQFLEGKKGDDGETKVIVVGRSAELKITDEKTGIVIMNTNIPYGSQLLAKSKS